MSSLENLTEKENGNIDNGNKKKKEEIRKKVEELKYYDKLAMGG